ncbi:FHA domain-containing protein [Streptomyces sp. NPDC057638]|uniref:FHA domain-containing protein n=1 Tax=Streptomyces sp. NPDC057638 TaxID=3346190 RepID=UPI0036C8036C
MPTCPNGHQSGSDDWCEICGHRMAGPGAPTGSVPPPPRSGYGYGYPGPGDATAVAELCPQCRTPREQLAPFCEECRYNFLTQTATSYTPIAPAPQPPSPGPHRPQGFDPQPPAGPRGGHQPPPLDPYEYQGSRPSQLNRPAEPLSESPVAPLFPTGPGGPGGVGGPGGHGGLGDPNGPGGHGGLSGPGGPGGHSGLGAADPIGGPPGFPQGPGRPGAQPPSFPQGPSAPAGPQGGGTDDWTLPPPAGPQGGPGTGQALGGFPPPPGAGGQPSYGGAAGAGQQPGPGLTDPRSTPGQLQSGPSSFQQPRQTGWAAVIAPDREYFMAMMQRSGPDASGLNLPAYSPEQRLVLTGNQVTIGRRRQSTGEAPDIDLSVPPEDPGVSHQHAVLVQQPDGSWSVVDQNSTNGTTINGSEEPIQPYVPVPLNDGDRVHVGAWTTITVRRNP